MCNWEVFPKIKGNKLRIRIGIGEIILKKMKCWKGYVNVEVGKEVNLGKKIY
jgi:hypothetical protein